MRMAFRKDDAAMVAAAVACLLVLAQVALSPSPIPPAVLALALLVAGLQVPSLSVRRRRLLFLLSLVAGVGSLALLATRLF